MGLGLPTFSRVSVTTVITGAAREHRVVSRHNASDPQFCTPRSSSFLVEIFTSGYQKQGTNSACPGGSRALEHEMITVSPYPLPTAQDETCILQTLSLVLSLSLSVLPLNDHGDLLCFSLDAYLIWCLSRSDPGITCIRIP